MFWIWWRGGPSAVFAFVLVVAVFVVLYVVGSRVAVWLPPFLIIPVFGFVVLAAFRSVKRDGGGDSGEPDSR
jgi:hypothetical protein